MGGDLEPPLQEALDSLDDLDRKSNVEAVDALRGFIATLEAGGTQRGPQIPRAEADRLAAGAEKVILQLGSPPAAPATKTYRSERHAVEFRHPGRWLVGDCPDRAACLAVYRRQADLGTDRYLAALEFVALGLEKAAERAGFQKQGGGWVLPGRFGDSRAEEISGSGWKGIQVTQACPVSDGWTGFHAAGGDCLTAVLSSRGRAVLIDTPGDPPTGAELFALIRSVSFLEAGK
jgi:hypothetical protein